MRPFIVIAGDAHPALARRVAELASAKLVPTTVGAFADGESRVHIESDVSGADLYVVQPTSPPANERLMTLALIVDAARAAGAARITAVTPYFGYARQDVRKRSGEPRWRNGSPAACAAWKRAWTPLRKLPGAMLTS